MFLRMFWSLNAGLGLPINPLPNDKILHVTKLKVDKLNVKMMISLNDRVENTVGKGKKCWLPAFSPFLAPLAKGQRAIVMALCPLCVCPFVHPSVRFSSETLDWIFTKFHRNVP